MTVRVSLLRAGLGSGSAAPRAGLVDDGRDVRDQPGHTLPPECEISVSVV